MATIKADMSAPIAANSMVLYERTMTSTMASLLSNLVINRAKDDAAGRAISSKVISRIRGLGQGSASL